MPRFGLRLGDAREQAPVAVCVRPVLCHLSGTRFTSYLEGKPLSLQVFFWIDIVFARHSRISRTVSQVASSWVPVSK